MSDSDLLSTQRWVQAYIVTGAAADRATAIVQPSAALSALERVGIYRDMYLARLIEALESDYPAVRHYLGTDGFGALAARYLEAHPSESYTLNRLGDRFPAFLAGRESVFLHDLARLELALTEVFDASESPVLGDAAIAAVPPEAWETARLKPIAAFRLLDFRYPVSEYLGAVGGENPFSPIRRRRTWVAAYRRNFSAHRLELKRPAFELLSALASGTPLGEAVAQCHVSRNRMFEWFRDWTSAGLFAEVVCN